MYAVNDTFDDVRDGDTVHNKAVTNKNKDTQVRTVSVCFSKVQVFNKLSAQWVSMNTLILRIFFIHLHQISI